MRALWIAAGIVLLASTSLPNIAAAQPEPPEAGSIQLHLDASLFRAEILPDLADTISLGFAGMGLGPGFGYQVADGVILGTRLSLAMTRVAVGAAEFVAGSLSLLPYLEFLLGDDNVAVPFVAFQAGLQGIFPADADPITRAIFGLRTGVHLFATSSFSVSPWLVGNLVWRTDIEHAAIDIGLGLSLVGWIAD